MKRNFALREHTYGEIKARWGLGAQAAQHVVKKTCDAYATLKANLKAGNLGTRGSKRYRRATGKPIAFRPEGGAAVRRPDAVLADSRAHGSRSGPWRTGQGRRVHRLSRSSWPSWPLHRKGESDLLYQGRQVVPERHLRGPRSRSEHRPGRVPRGRPGDREHRRHLRRRAPCGRRINRKRATGSQAAVPSCRRRTPSPPSGGRRRRGARKPGGTRTSTTRSRSGSWRRLNAPVAGSPWKTLTGIRERVRLAAKPQRSHDSHSLGLRPARRVHRVQGEAGPGCRWCTSIRRTPRQECSECHHIDKANRPSQAWFACRVCGFVDHADRNGVPQHPRQSVGVVATRGAVNGPRPTPGHRGVGQDANAAPQPVTPVVQARGFSPGSLTESTRRRGA